MHTITFLVYHALPVCATYLCTVSVVPFNTFKNIPQGEHNIQAQPTKEQSRLVAVVYW